MEKSKGKSRQESGQKLKGNNIGTKKSLPQDAKISIRQAQDKSFAKQGLKLGIKNWILIGAGIICVVGGYFLLNLKMLVPATLVLIAGYCVFIPIGIMAKVK